MGRSPCCEKVGLKKGSWTPEEDQKLTSYIQEHGHGSWRALPVKAGLQRCGKSCRLRWTNYLRPDIKRGKFTLQEEQTMIQLHALLGNRWSAIATHLPKRTDNEIKNYWNTHLKKRLIKMGIDPVTHKSKNYALGSGSGTGQSKEVANLSHMAQWESARLEAEARFVREYKHSSGSVLGHPLIQRQHQHHYKQITSIPGPPTTLDVVNAWHSLWSSGSESDCAAFGDSVFSSSDDALPIGTLPISTENSRKKKDEINDWNDHCVQVEVPSATTPFPGMQSTWINAESIGNEDNVFVEGSYHTILPVPDNSSSSFGEDYSDNANGNCTAGSQMVQENNHFWNNIVSLLDSSSAYSFENV